MIDESEQTLTLSCGGGSRVNIVKSVAGTADSQTQAQWRVQRLAAELADLRCRVVKIEEYDDPGFTTEDGIYDAGFALFASSPIPQGIRCRCRDTSDANGSRRTPAASW